MDEVKKIVVLDSEIQAELIDSILNDRNIPHVMRTYHDSAYDGLFQAGQGWGHIEAEEKHREEIVTIFKDVKKQSES
ncbi:MAG TPA: hypothetical protein EYQ50_05610 [Verrucomicrobiales bacterium]|jgi:hypothetical protein|nr:hypothetical protein [Verrucomicrobiales bacterium]HIL69916.1 hypothetical protein [Verrucomicrobiota bacterium]